MFSLKTKKNLLKLDQKTGLFKNKKFFVEIFFLLLVGGGNSNVGDDVDESIELIERIKETFTSASHFLFSVTKYIQLNVETTLVLFTTLLTLQIYYV